MNDYQDMPQVVKNFLNYTENIQGKSEKTVREYYYDLRTFFRYIKCVRGQSDFDDFENVSVDDVDMALIQTITIDDMYDYLFYVNKKRSNGARSRARKVSSIKSFYKFLYSKAKLIAENPAKELEAPKMPKSLPVHLSLEESKQLLNSVDGSYQIRNYAILTLFLNCGLRLSELVGINLSRLKEDRLTVIGKGNKERTIYLNSACQAALNAYLPTRENDRAKDKDALFLSRNGNRISNRMVQTIVKNALKEAGLDDEKYSTHKLRHTAATLMYQYGDVDIRALQEILGHKELSTTQIYTHVDNAKLKKALDMNPLANMEPTKSKKEK